LRELKNHLKETPVKKYIKARCVGRCVCWRTGWWNWAMWKRSATRPCD